MNPLSPKIKVNGENQIAHGASQVMLSNIFLTIILIVAGGIQFLIAKNISNTTLGIWLLFIFAFNLRLFSRQLYTILALKLANNSNYMKTETGALIASVISAILVAVFSLHYFDILSASGHNEILLTIFTVLSVAVIANESGLIPSLLVKKTSVANQYPTTKPASIKKSESSFYVPKKKLMILNTIYYIAPILLGGLFISLI